MPPLFTGRNGASTTAESDADVHSSSLLERRYLRLPLMSRVSIQSKLLVMLLITSVLSAAVVGLHRVFIGSRITASLGLRPNDRDPPVADAATAVEVRRFDEFSGRVFAR